MVLCCLTCRAFGGLPIAKAIALVSPLNRDPFLSCGKLKGQGEAETCSSLSRLPCRKLKQGQTVRHRRRSHLAIGVCIQTPESPFQDAKCRERDELRPVLAFKISNPELRPSSTISVDGDWVLLSLQETSQVTVCFTERVTCLQRYSENLLSPSSCKPSRGKILKNRSTWGKSPCFIAVSNFSVTIVFRRCSASCRSFRLASIMPPGQKNKKEREE